MNNQLLHGGSAQHHAVCTCLDMSSGSVQCLSDPLQSDPGMLSLV